MTNILLEPLLFNWNSGVFFFFFCLFLKCNVKFKKHKNHPILLLTRSKKTGILVLCVLYEVNWKLIYFWALWLIPLMIVPERPQACEFLSGLLDFFQSEVQDSRDYRVGSCLKTVRLRIDLSRQNWYRYRDLLHIHAHFNKPWKPHYN